MNAHGIQCVGCGNFREKMVEVTEFTKQNECNTIRYRKS